MNRHLITLALCALALVSCGKKEGAKDINRDPEYFWETCLFAPGDYDSKNWRIPAICTLDDGTLLCATDKRKYNQNDLPADIDIVVRRSTDGGHTWCDPITVAEGTGEGAGFGDALLVNAADGSVVMAYAGGNGVWASTANNPISTYVRRSTDGGLSWSDAQDLTSLQWGSCSANPDGSSYHASFFGSGHGLLLTKGEHAGRIIIVSALHNKRASRFDNYALYSDDNGLTWSISERAYRGGDEAKVVELSDGRILMSVRRDGARGYSISEDGGQTWPETGYFSDITVTACNGDIITYKDSTLLHSLPNAGTRKNVSVFVSEDDGKTWPYVKTICEGQSAYSSMTLLKDGTIGMYYEKTRDDGQQEMWFANFSWAWLMKSE